MSFRWNDKSKTANDLGLNQCEVVGSTLKKNICLKHTYQAKKEPNMRGKAQKKKIFFFKGK